MLLSRPQQIRCTKGVESDRFIIDINVAGITDFITAKSLLEVVDKMVAEDDDDRKSEEHISTRLRAEMFNETHKDDVYRLLFESRFEIKYTFIG
jgi:hypothetical protein